MAFIDLPTDRSIPITQISLIQNVIRLASMIVLETPPAKNDYTPTAYVRRDLIRDLEYALVAAGVDMKAAHERMNAALKERSQTRKGLRGR